MIKTEKSLLIILGLGLVLLLSASLKYRLEHPSLVRENDRPRQMSQAPDSTMNAVTAMMQKLKDNPNDDTALTSLAEHFLHLQDFKTAEDFAAKSLALKPDNPQVLYILGVSQHGQGQFQAAANTLEKALSLKPDPHLYYSLGILYAHYLQNKNKGLENLKKSLSMPGISPELVKNIEDEINVLSQTN